VSITVSSTVVANAGSDQGICASTTATLAGNAAAPGTGAWSSLGTALVTTPSSAISGVTALANGANTFVWTITNGACVTRDTVVITVSALVASAAGADQSLCIGSPITMAANSPSPGTGLWTALSSGTITTPTSATTTITGLSSAGTYNFVWTITNGSCVSRDTVAITVNDVITPDAGFDIQLCNTFTTVLNSNDPTPGVGAWSSPSGATIASPNIPSTTVSNMVLGDNIFVWTITNGSCVASDTIHVFVDSVIVPDAGIDQTVCSGTSSVLMANDPTPGTGLWTTTSTANITIPNLENTPVDNLVDAGAQMFIWTITNGVCTSSDTVYINVDSLIVADAGSDQQLCETFTTTLKSNDVTPGTGTWSTLGSATFVDVNDPMTAVSNLDYGDNLFIWSVTNGTCSSEDTLIIRVDSIINPLAGADQTICSSVGQVVLAANDPTPGIGVWTTSSTAVFSDSSQAATTAAGLIYAGSYELVWTIENGTCIASDTVVITVDSNDVAIAGPDQQFCETTTSTNLAGTAATIGTGVWSTTGTSTIVDVNDPATEVNSLAYGDNIYVWTITNGTCITSDTVIVHVDSLVNATAGADQTICSSVGQVVLAANDPIPGIGAWSTSSSAVFADASQAGTTATGLSISGNYDLIWTITNGTCISSDTLTITVDSNDVAIAGPDQQFCETTTSTNLAATAATIGTGVWSTPGTSTIVDVNDPATEVNSLAYGDNIYVWTITNGTCTTSDTVIVHVDSLVNATAGADQTICSSVGQVVLAANDPTPGIGTWSTSSTAVFADSSQAGTTASGLSIAGNYDLIWTITNGTCISSDTLTITVDSNDVAVAGPDQQLCETISSTNLSATPATIGTGVWSTTSAAIITDVNDPATSVSGLVIGDNIFVWTITSGTCVTIDTIDVVISQQTDPANAGSDQNVCSSLASATISGNTPLVGTGSWTSLGTAVVDTASSVTTTVSNLSLGSNLFVYTITNGACSSSDTVDVVMFANPTADAGVDQFTTSGTPVTIGGSPVASGGTAPYVYTWNPGTVLDDSLIANPLATVIATTTFIITITDSIGCNAQDTVVVWINNPPVLQNDTLTIDEDSTVVIYPLLNDSDPDNNLNLGTLAILNGPFYGTATVDTMTGTITYVPNANYYGQDSIMYTLCDSGMPVYCDTAWIYLNLNPINDAPLAIDDVDSTVEDSCIQIAVLANDTDVENAIIVGSLVTFNGPSNGTLSLDTLTGIITYCPDSNFAGVDTFYYAICDSGYPAPGLCDTAMVIITVNSKNDPPIALNDSVAVCANDSILIAVLTNDVDQEGDPLSVSVTLGPNYGTSSVDLAGNIMYVPDPTYSGLDSLQYTVCDNQSPAGCDTAWVFVDVRGVPVLASVVSNNKCYEDSLGTIDLTITGNGGFTVSWDNGSVEEDLDSLASGIYTVTVVDTLGCSVSRSDTIFGPALPLDGIMNLQPVLCHADTSGAIDLQPSGGTAPYYFSWSNGSTDEDIDSLAAGEYTVILSDTNGCQISITDTILQPDSALTASITVTDITCAGDSTGSILVIPAGGTASYTYLWNNGVVADSLTAIPAGLYSVTVKDSNGCLITLADSVMELNAPIVIDSIVVQPYCLDNILGSVEIIPSGGLSPFQYAWSNGDTLSVIDTLTAGAYNVQVTDANGCSKSFATVLSDTSNISIQVTGATTFCSGDSVTLTATNSAYVTY
ncbi:MAG TPA: Ig-like domain-containing protein, partial [Bacteroidia bacterium]|nr:Ig-like domain-containing protein [Bacteroidia bacterium]